MTEQGEASEHHRRHEYPMLEYTVQRLGDLAIPKASHEAPRLKDDRDGLGRETVLFCFL